MQRTQISMLFTMDGVFRLTVFSDFDRYRVLRMWSTFSHWIDWYKSRDYYMQFRKVICVFFLLGFSMWMYYKHWHILLGLQPIVLCWHCSRIFLFCQQLCSICVSLSHAQLSDYTFVLLLLLLPPILLQWVPDYPNSRVPLKSQNQSDKWIVWISE